MPPLNIDTLKVKRAEHLRRRRHCSNSHSPLLIRHEGWAWAAPGFLGRFSGCMGTGVLVS